ncbi:universal stress protein [Pseudomonas sp. BBP2017]|uniref:universal stress protein n=1 Tax=Pseudomonas sp. BBP2017 TaxID=2109731 RepID=UPI000D121A8C|nr:universal stress protein [Pseudomonas sp. BBP2017]PSS51661.1 universal stress protein [Pseudomonas sp. BBP2017]
MKAFSRLLLICHPELHASAAMARAQALARSTAATLHLVILSKLPSRLATLNQALHRSAHKQEQERRQAWLNEQVHELRNLGIKAYAETVDEDDPLNDLMRLAQLHRIDMIIKDITYETALSRALLKPLDWQLLRHSPVPLHLVAHAELQLPTRVLAAVDLSQDDPVMEKLNTRILESAKAIALQCKAQLHLVQAYDWNRSFVAYAAVPVAWNDQLLEQMTGHANERMHQLGARFGIDTGQQHMIKGPATCVISDYANQNGFDVVVMGTLYHEGISRIVGSTTEQALYKVRSSILAIHS